MSKEEKWTDIIRAKSGWYDVDLASLWSYRDLVFLFVKRDFISVYKQTILGPLWSFIQPLFTTLAFTVIFGNIAKINTDDIPKVLFYMCGITLWTYFADCLNRTAGTFMSNAGMFGKVYFPRLVVPISILFSNLVKFGIQFSLFICLWIYFIVKGEIEPNYMLLWVFPILVIMMAGLGLGFGMLISSVTTKYRDIAFLVGFGVQLLMYASPIVYPLSEAGEYSSYLLLNPVTSIIEAFKYIFLGNGFFSLTYLLYSLVFMFVLLFISIGVFSKVEKYFMDTI